MTNKLYLSAIWPITAKLRQNWRREAAHLPIPQKAAAFTLIELSIVLVIIGLIVGGVLVGQDMIETAKRQQIVSEWQEISAQVNTFRLKYNCLPGDCKNANQFFAGSSNGDGNRMITIPGGSFGHSGIGFEACKFWYHLSSSDLIKYDFPICGGATNVYLHSPALPFNSKTSWVVVAECNAADCNATAGFKGDGHWIWTQGVYNNWPYWQLGAGGFSAQWQAPFTVDDVRWFDTKVDDGNGLTGKMTLMTGKGQIPADGASSCADSTSANGFKANASYLGNPRQCNLRFKTNF